MFCTALQTNRFDIKLHIEASTLPLFIFFIFVFTTMRKKKRTRQGEKEKKIKKANFFFNYALLSMVIGTGSCFSAVFCISMATIRRSTRAIGKGFYHGVHLFSYQNLSHQYCIFHIRKTNYHSVYVIYAFVCVI